jgi:hypothetical protein
MFARYPDSKWLCGIPLGNRDVYDDIFWREKAIGENIDAVMPREVSDEEEVSFGDDEEPEGMQTSRRRRRREDSGDPDVALESNSASVLSGVTTLAVLIIANRQAREDRDSVFTSGLMNTAT